MCGFAGIARATGSATSPDELCARLAAMAQCMRLRGPDAQSWWTAPDSRVGLAHARLAIRDLSPAGAQPLTSRDGRWTIAYNGEIYNAGEVADALRAEGHPGFRGHSDTEVLADAIAAWGVDRAVQRCAGMLAFAAVDLQERRLVVVRDRIGIKPAMWAWTGADLVVGSDTRLLRGLPGAPRTVRAAALDRYLRLGRVEGDEGLLEGVHKVPPGGIAEWRLDGLRAGDAPQVRSYWRPERALASALQEPLEGDDEHILDTVEGELSRIVADHLVSDVPVGAFLSGGIDSSLVVALLRRRVGVPVRTFTIGFDESDHDESRHAAEVARHLGTDHHEQRVRADDALATLDELAEAWDEPFADSSAIPTLIVSRMARRDVTVVLTGDGGDEGFGGYDRYVWLPRVSRLRARLGSPGRAVAAAALGALAMPAAARAFAMAHPVLPRQLRVRQMDRKAARMAAALAAADPCGLHDATLESWPRAQQLVPDLHGDEARRWPPAGFAEAGELRGYMLADLQRYLVDDILTKLDRATMAVSLEGRVPYLDHRVIELSMRLPQRMLVRDGVAKWTLRALLARHVPRTLFERPKSGFTVPVGAWLRGPLRGWAEQHMTAHRLEEVGVIPEPFLRAWREHLSGTADRSAALWTLLMYLRWRDRLD